MEIPEHVLLWLHSQLSSDRLVLPQGLQDRGLWPRLNLVVHTLWGLLVCLVVHHSGLEKGLELDCLFPENHVHPGLPFLEPDLDRSMCPLVFPAVTAATRPSVQAALVPVHVLCADMPVSPAPPAPAARTGTQPCRLMPLHKPIS